MERLAAVGRGEEALRFGGHPVDLEPAEIICTGDEHWCQQLTSEGRNSRRTRAEATAKAVDLAGHSAQGHRRGRGREVKAGKGKSNDSTFIPAVALIILSRKNKLQTESK